MKILTTILLIIVGLNTYSQHLIGKDTNALKELGLSRLDDSTYISIDKDVDINTWVVNNGVVLEQYVVHSEKTLQELLDLIEEHYILAVKSDSSFYYTSKVSGVTCLINDNVFTLFYKK